MEPNLIRLVDGLLGNAEEVGGLDIIADFAAPAHLEHVLGAQTRITYHHSR